eukprot:10512975-Prorocentrum_lima.AAC.1
MTSSLVGSEMCIRDRLSVAHSPAMQHRPDSQAKLRTDQAEEESDYHNKIAVSYTHLTLPTICSV